MRSFSPVGWDSPGFGESVLGQALEEIRSAHHVAPLLSKVRSATAFFSRRFSTSNSLQVLGVIGVHTGRMTFSVCTGANQIVRGGHIAISAGSSTTVHSKQLRTLMATRPPRWVLAGT